MILAALRCGIGLWKIYAYCSLANTSQVLSRLQNRTVGFYEDFGLGLEFTKKAGFALCLRARTSFAVTVSWLRKKS